MNVCLKQPTIEANTIKEATLSQPMVEDIPLKVRKQSFKTKVWFGNKLELQEKAKQDSEHGCSALRLQV